MFKYLTIIALLVLSVSVHAEILTEHAIVEKVNQIIQATQKPQAKNVWPGFRFEDAPTVISFSNGHIYALDSKSQNPAWQKGKIGRQILLSSAQDHWNVAAIPFLAHFDLEGESAYAFNMDPVIQTGNLLSYHIFVHERFHRYQFEHFTQKRSNGNYRDQINVENLALMQLEERALVDFFTQTGAVKKEALLDFLTLNTVRRLFIAPSSVLWEDHQQQMEGMAEYVSFKLFDTFPSLEVENGTQKLTELLQQYKGNPEITERAIKWRHYGIGAALGYALDELQVSNWKKSIENEDTSLYDLLERASPIALQDLLERYNLAAVRYQLSETQDAVAATIQRYNDNTEDVMQTYHQMDGVEVSITSPTTVAISGKGKTGKHLSLPDGSNVSINDTSVFSSSDQKWHLELTEHPYVFQTGAAREFKCENDAVLEIDGQQVTVQDIVKSKQPRLFSNIRIEGKGTHFFSLEALGKIWVDGAGKLLIRFR